jgi:hypothetical protein
MIDQSGIGPYRSRAGPRLDAERVHRTVRVVATGPGFVVGAAQESFHDGCSLSRTDQ